jgi:hypothetical protein
MTSIGNVGMKSLVKEKRKMAAKSRINKDFVIAKKYKFRLEIYLALEGHEDICWEIFPQDYNSCLYAFSNKKKLDSVVKKKYIYEKKVN